MLSMRIYSLALSIGFCFLFLGVTFASDSDIQMDSVQQIHLEKGKVPLFYHLTGKFTDNEIKGSSFWGYVEALKEDVKEKRETCITLNDIEEWANFNRNSYTTNFEVNVWGKPDFYRLLYTYPSKTISPWLIFTEMIVNEKNCFFVDHTKRNISLTDNSDFIETQKKSQDFPALASFLYPYNFIRENEGDYTVALKDRGDGVVDFVAINKNENPQPMSNGLYTFYKEIRAELLVDKEYCAQKCLIKRCNTARMDIITAMQFSDFNNTIAGYFPGKATIIKWWQYTRPEDKPESDEMKYLLPSLLTWELPNDFSDRIFSRKWVGDIREVRFTIDLNDEIFWPSAPDGYLYTDRRSRFDEMNKAISNLSEEQLKTVLGTGPHTFAR